MSPSPARCLRGDQAAGVDCKIPQRKRITSGQDIALADLSLKDLFQITGDTAVFDDLNSAIVLDHFRRVS